MIKPLKHHETMETQLFKKHETSLLKRFSSSWDDVSIIPLYPKIPIKNTTSQVTGQILSPQTNPCHAFFLQNSDFCSELLCLDRFPSLTGKPQRAVHVSDAYDLKTWAEWRLCFEGLRLVVGVRCKSLLLLLLLLWLLLLWWWWWSSSFLFCATKASTSSTQNNEKEGFTPKRKEIARGSSSIFIPKTSKYKILGVSEKREKEREREWFRYIQQRQCFAIIRKAKLSSPNGKAQQVQPYTNRSLESTIPIQTSSPEHCNLSQKERLSPALHSS